MSRLEWSSSDKPLAIRLSLDTVEHLGFAVKEAFKALPRRGLEVGGFLFGRLIPGDPTVRVIEDFELIESEHRRGPSYLLSGKDTALLEERLAAAAAKPGQAVIGYWRSHTRPGMCLDEEDLAIIRRYFSDPSQVILLVKPSATEGSTGALFFWENGDIKCETPDYQFPFDRAQLLAGGYRIVSGPEGPQAGAREPGLMRRAESSRAGRVPAVAPQARWYPDIRQMLLRPRWTWVSLAAVAILVLFVMVFPRGGIPPSRATSPESPPQVTSPDSLSDLSLKVEQDGNALRLSWNRNSRPILNATEGILWITDGSRRHVLNLEKKQLTHGSFVYFKGGADVDFELEVITPERLVSESVRTLSLASGPVLSRSAPSAAPPARSSIPGTPKNERPQRRTVSFPPDPLSDGSL